MNILVYLFALLVYLEGCLAWSVFFEAQTPQMERMSQRYWVVMWPFIFIPLILGFAYILWPRQRKRKNEVS